MIDRSARGRESLARLRLSPSVLVRNLREGSARLDGLARMMRSLDPDAVLQRGYARILGPAGTRTDKAVAEKEAALTIKFRDGELAVTSGDASPRSPRPAPQKKPSHRQDDLFG